MFDFVRRSKCFAVVLLCFLSVVLIPSIVLFARGGKEKKEVGSDRQTFRVPVDVVVVNAAVVDKNGKPVTDLSAKDFRVFEDGEPQEIQTFALEAYGRYDEGGRAAATPAERTAIERQSEAPRLISFVIDDLTMESVENFPRMVEAIRNYVRNEMAEGEQLAILSGSGRVQVPFSDNRQRLLDELATIRDRLNLIPPSRSTCPRLNDRVAFALTDIQNRLPINKRFYIEEALRCLNLEEEGLRRVGSRARDGEMRQESTLAKTAEQHLMMQAEHQRLVTENAARRMLQTLRQHIRVLRRFEGDKAVVFLSEGLLCEAEQPEAYQLQEIIDLALRSGIVFNAVSLRSVGTGYDATAWKDPRLAVLGGWGWDSDSEANRRAKESPLSQLAQETGGAFSPDRNDLRLALQEVARHRSYNYVLSYSIPAHPANGGYHKIRLELNRPDLRLSYRKGYYVQKEELQYERGSRADIIEALNAPGNLKQIPMTLSYNYSEQDDSTYAVSFVTRVDIKGVQFAEEDARRTNMVNLVLAAFDENDKFIEGVNKSIEFRMLEESYVGLRNRGLVSSVELKLPPGRYKIKAVVRENNQGRMGSAVKSVEIP